MESGSDRRRYTLRHPPYLKPEDVLSFIHHPLFTQSWSGLGLDDDDLVELGLCIMACPRCGHEINGVPGLRFMNVTSEARTYRPPISVYVYYASFEEQSIAALLEVVEKSDEDDEITTDDSAKLRKLIEEITKDLG